MFIVSMLAVWGCSQGVKPEEKKSYAFTFKNEWINSELTNRLKGVYIGGAFNGWKYKTSPLAYSNGVWITNILLAPGEYLYKYVCIFDGMWEDLWIHDFGNPDLRINEFGSFNSALVIDKDGNVPSVKVYDEKDSAHFKFFYKASDFKNNSIDDYIAVSEKNTEKLAAFLKIKLPQQKITVYLETNWNASWDLNAFQSIILYGIPRNQHIFIHELVHVLVYNYKSLAMNEGLAQYCEEVLYPYDKSGTSFAVPVNLIVAGLFKAGVTNTVEYYMNNPKEFWWTENPLTGATYCFMSSFTEYLVKKSGMDSLLKLFHSDFDFKTVYNKTVTELDKDWKASMAGKKYNEDELLIIDWMSADIGFFYQFSQMNKKNKVLSKNEWVKMRNLNRSGIIIHAKQII